MMLKYNLKLFSQAVLLMSRRTRVFVCMTVYLYVCQNLHTMEWYQTLRLNLEQVTKIRNLTGGHDVGM